MAQKQVLMTGIDESVLDELGLLVGQVGFHDFDGYIEKPELETKVKELATHVGTHVYCLKTGFGYHFLTFEVLPYWKYYRWKRQCRKLFPSDYKDDLCEKCLKEMDIEPTEDGKKQYVCRKCGMTKLLVKRVLRISPKPSKEGQAMRPTFLLSWHFYRNRQYDIKDNLIEFSKAHMDVYSDSSLFGSAMIPNLYEDIVETTSTMGVEIELFHSKVALCKYLTKAHLEVEE